MFEANIGHFYHVQWDRLSHISTGTNMLSLCSPCQYLRPYMLNDSDPLAFGCPFISGCAHASLETRNPRM